MPTYVAAYNAMFGKVVREAYDAHRPIRADEDLNLIFTWREQRKVTSNLTLHYERKLYLLPDTPVGCEQPCTSHTTISWAPRPLKR